MAREQIDWNRLWQENQVRPPGEDQLEFWDGFAAHFRKKVEDGEKDPYVEQFYEYSELQPGETIFDMGCASGTLAIPYALRGHEVWAADFSSEMLKYLMVGAEEAGVADRIHPVRLDWNEDWSKREDLPLCDVAISSRSFMPWDLSKGLRDLESVCSKRVCVGAWDTPTNGYEREIAGYIGYDRPGFGCYGYIMNELMERDMFPRLRFMKSPFRLSKYDSREQALEAVTGSFQYGLTVEQEKLIEEYCAEHLLFHEEEGGSFWRFDHSEMSTMAHIMWDVKTRRK